MQGAGARRHQRVARTDEHDQLPQVEQAGGIGDVRQAHGQARPQGGAFLGGAGHDHLIPFRREQRDQFREPLKAPLHRAALRARVQDHALAVRPQQAPHRAVGNGRHEARARGQLVQRPRARDAEGAQQLRVELRLVEVAVPAAQGHPGAGHEPVPPAVAGADAQRDARPQRLPGHGPVGQHMHDRIGADALQQAQAVRVQVLPDDDAVHVRAARQHGRRVAASEEYDLRLRVLITQDARQRQREHHVADAVGAADDDGAGRLHACRSRSS